MAASSGRLRSRNRHMKAWRARCCTGARLPAPRAPGPAPRGCPSAAPRPPSPAAPGSAAGLWRRLPSARRRAVPCHLVSLPPPAAGLASKGSPNQAAQAQLEMLQAATHPGRGPVPATVRPRRPAAPIIKVLVRAGRARACHGHQPHSISQTRWAYAGCNTLQHPCDPGNHSVGSAGPGTLKLRPRAPLDFTAWRCASVQRGRTTLTRYLALQ